MQSVHKLIVIRLEDPRSNFAVQYCPRESKQVLGCQVSVRVNKITLQQVTMLISLLFEGFRQLIIFGITNDENCLDMAGSVPRPGITKCLTQSTVGWGRVDEDQKRSCFQAICWLLQQNR